MKNLMIMTTLLTSSALSISQEQSQAVEIAPLELVKKGEACFFNETTKQVNEFVQFEGHDFVCISHRNIKDEIVMSWLHVYDDKKVEAVTDKIIKGKSCLAGNYAINLGSEIKHSGFNYRCVTSLITGTEYVITGFTIINK